MVIAKCTKDGGARPRFDFSLVDGLENSGPYIDFELPTECWPDYYEGAGVFTVELKALLEENFEDYYDHAHGKYTSDFIVLLRDLADKLEANLAERKRL